MENRKNTKIGADLNRRPRKTHLKEKEHKIKRKGKLKKGKKAKRKSVHSECLVRKNVKFRSSILDKPLVLLIVNKRRVDVFVLSKRLHLNDNPKKADCHIHWSWEPFKCSI